MNRIVQLFQRQTNNILSIFNTAGFPRLEDTVMICKELEQAGVNMIELGFPFSDPIADGTTIQHSSNIALKNGMSLTILFKQLQHLRSEVKIPVLLMGYLNPVIQFGIEKFCQKCAETGIDGLIIPDLPFEEYCNLYQEMFARYNLSNIFLITERTSEERIRAIDAISNGFIYVVSTASVTGLCLDVDKKRQEYFERIRNMKLKNPLIVGFGIHDKASFDEVTKYAHGGIIASAFIRKINQSNNTKQTIHDFVHMIKGN